MVEEIANQFEQKYNNSAKSKNEISTLFDEYIRKLKLPNLSEEERRECDSKITEDTAFAALKSMNKDSAPGTDGLPVEFYLIFWKQLKALLLNNYHYSFLKGHLTHSERVGIISLFHKGKDLPTYILSNWRPISLTNVDYKIAAKMFSMKLDVVIHKLIGGQQTGFMKGRQVSKMHRQIDDLLQLNRNKKKMGILLAIDFKAAFDTINIECILKSLKAFGFGPDFIKWITILNTDRLACVKNGGHVSRLFSMQNGVRQGCPISPQLFILAVEILAQKIIQDKNILGLSPNNRGNPIKISQYADDTTLFLRNLEEMRRAIKHLDEFSKFSDLYLNLNKSFALSTNGQPINTEDLNITFKDTIKILGIYFSNKKNACEIEDNWNERINKVIQIFGQWSKRNISIIGKSLIIKTFALSQFVFVMKSIALPTKVLDRINRYCFSFLWMKKFSITSKATEKIKRKVLCGPKSEGGLRLFDMQQYQNSILLEWAEKLLDDENAQWKEWASEFYRSVGGLNVFKSKVTLKEFKGLETVHSPYWREVLKRWIMYNKSTQNPSHPVSIYDPIHNNTNIRYRNNVILSKTAIEKGCITIKDFLAPNGQIKTMQEYREAFGQYNGDFMDHHLIKQGLQALNLRNLLQIDLFTFNGVKIGQLGRRYFLNDIYEAETPTCVETWVKKYNITINSSHWDLLHKLKETKLKALSFKILHNIYPSYELLYKMKLTITPNCPLCGQLDTLDHFFYHCIKVKKLWKEVTTEINSFLGIKIRLDEKVVLLGANLITGIGNRNTIQINMAIAIAKLAISKFRYGTTRPILDIYYTESNIRKLWVNFQ